MSKAATENMLGGVPQAGSRQRRQHRQAKGDLKQHQLHALPLEVLWGLGSWPSLLQTGFSSYSDSTQGIA